MDDPWKTKNRITIWPMCYQVFGYHFVHSVGWTKKKWQLGKGGTVDRLGWLEAWGRQGEIGGSLIVTVIGLAVTLECKALEGPRHSNSHWCRGQMSDRRSYRCNWNWDAPVPRSKTKAINFIRRRPRDRTLPGVFSDPPLVPSFGLAPAPTHSHFVTVAISWDWGWERLHLC